MRLLITLSLSIILLFALPANAEISRDKDLKIETLATGLSIPWGMAVMPDNNLLITQRDGKLVRLNPQSGKLTDISGLPGDIRVEGQGGLFDVALPPDYQDSQWIYFSYTKDVDGQGATTLARAKLSGTKLVDWQELLVTKSRTDNTVHYGGRIAFDGKGHVFLSIGDRGVRDNAQTLSNHAGSILKLNMDGSVPEDNPFTDRQDALPEIWSYGHRNPQGLFFNLQTNQLWEVEHGPRGGDEINLIEAGNNYGWPVISYGQEYGSPQPVGEGTHKEGMEQPVKVYVPSIATSSLVQYQGQLLNDWHGKLLVGALKQQHLNVITLDANLQATDEEKLLRTVNDRIRNIIEAPDGALLVGTDSGQILRITPAHANR